MWRVIHLGSLELLFKRFGVLHCPYASVILNPLGCIIRLASLRVDWYASCIISRKKENLV